MKATRQSTVYRVTLLPTILLKVTSSLKNLEIFCCFFFGGGGVGETDIAEYISVMITIMLND